MKLRLPMLQIDGRFRKSPSDMANDFHISIASTGLSVQNK